ncbi:MAG: myxosortase-dependent metalloprotease, MXAN_2677/MXAN_2678 family [Archangium sp.]|nr:myxosortase-dependent metalloprotease, MXAN_2677/MXAN_2678 family [Archangium sp.]
MILQVALTIALSQAVRSRVDDKNPDSQCLWWPEDTAIQLRLSADGNPLTPADTEFAAIGRAITTWQTKLNSCSSLTLAEGARTGARQVGYFDKQANENIAVFRLRRCSEVAPAGDACHGEADNCGNQYDCWQHQEAAIAITTTSFNPQTGRILDSDIEYNSPTFTFSTVDSPPCPAGQLSTNCVAADVQNTTTHELGHLLGLGHSPAASSTMGTRANPGELSKRVLDADTAQFVCDVYPRGRPAQTCFLTPVSSQLGKSASGCTAAPGGLLLALAALLLRRRRG